MFCFIRGIPNAVLPSGGALRKRSLPDNLSGTQCHLIYNIAVNPVTDSYLPAVPATLSCFDGVLINAAQLNDTHALSGIDALLDKVLLDRDITLLSSFHGQFCGMAFDPQAGSGLLFTNQTGSSRLYYWHQGAALIVSSSLAMIVAVLRMNGFPASVDSLGARMLMELGFTVGDSTTIEGIKLLEPGHLLKWQEDTPRVEVYHSFDSEPRHHGMQKVVPQLNDLFREAVQAEYDWDTNHGKSHLAFLSGGLDSRMAVFTAASMGYRDMHCLNFSQSKAPDHLIAQSMAKALGIGYHFHALDGGSYLKQMERGLLYSDGQIIYHGTAHLDTALRGMDTSSFGVLHSGQVGDLILGSFLYAPRHEAPGSNSISLSPNSDPELDSALRAIAAKYSNHEIFALYNRAFNAASNGDLACALSNHAISPFLYPPFAQYCLNVHPALRYNNKLYSEWFKAFQPKAAAFKWDKTGLPISSGEKARALAKLLQRVKHKLARMGIISAGGMNPFELWLKQDPSLRSELEDRFAHADEHGILAHSAASTHYTRQKDSPHLMTRLQAYTAAHSLNQLLGGDPWVPDEYTGGFREF